MPKTALLPQSLAAITTEPINHPITRPLIDIPISHSSQQLPTGVEFSEQKNGPIFFAAQVVHGPTLWVFNQRHQLFNRSSPLISHTIILQIQPASFALSQLLLFNHTTKPICSCIFSLLPLFYFIYFIFLFWLVRSSIYSLSPFFFFGLICDFIDY